MRKPPRRYYDSKVPEAPIKGQEVILIDGPWIKYCNGCRVDHPVSMFSWRCDTGHGKVVCRLRPTCRKSHAAESRNRKNLQSEERLDRVIAPRQAAMRLIENNPEALARLVQLYRREFEGYLIEERAVLKQKYANQSQIQQRRTPEGLIKLTEDNEQKSA